MSTDVELGNTSQSNHPTSNNNTTVEVKEPFEGISMDQITMEYCLDHKEDCDALINLGHPLERQKAFAPILVTFFMKHDLVLWIPFTGLLCYSLKQLDTLTWILLGWFVILVMPLVFTLDIIMLLFHFILVPFRLIALPFCREEKAIDVLLWSVFILKWRPIAGLRCLRAHLAFYKAYGKDVFEKYSNTRFFNEWLDPDMEDRIEDVAETVPEAKMLWFEPHTEFFSTATTLYKIWKLDPWKAERKKRRKARRQRKKELKKQAKLAPNPV